MIYNFVQFINEKYLHYIDDINAIHGVDTSKVLNLVKDKETSEMFFREPTQDDVDFLNKYLNKNKYSMIELYHGTASYNNISKEGLHTTNTKNRRSGNVTSGFVYLSIFEETAKKFGEFGYPNEEISIYKVTIPIYFLKPDLDQLGNVLIYKGLETGKTLGDSALYGHAFRIKGDIPPYMIKKL